MWDASRKVTTMRDLDRVKDKIEIRLDPRQVVTLGVATTVFCGVLFGAGYWAGRRQARPAPAEPTDLATLDAASRAIRDETRSSLPSPALGDVEFLFPAVVAAGPARGPEQAPVRVPAVVFGDEPTAAAPESARLAETPRQPVPAPEPARAVEPPRPAAPPTEAPKPAMAAAPPSKEAVPPPPDELEAPRAPVEPAAIAPPSVAVAAVPPPPDEVPEDAPPPGHDAAAPTPKREATPEPPPGPAAGAKIQYTLQVKASKEKAVADEVVEKLRKAGFEPSLIMAEVPGKGRVYRVRVGRFESLEKARDFQRKLKAQSGLPDAGFVTDL